MNIIIPKKAFNPKFYPLLREDNHRYLLLYGGAGRGENRLSGPGVLQPPATPAPGHLRGGRGGAGGAAPEKNRGAV